MGSNILGSWAIQMCKSKNIANPKIAKSIVNLAALCTRAPNDLIVAQEMAMELAKTMQSPSEKSEIYPIINRSTENAIATGLLQLAESVIAEMDRLSMKLKTRLASAYKDGKHDLYLTLEETLYQRAEAVVELLSSFVVMNLKGNQLFLELFVGLIPQKIVTLFENVSRLNFDILKSVNLLNLCNHVELMEHMTI